MDTKEIVVDEDTMEMAVQYSARTGKSVDEVLDKYRYFIAEGHKKLDFKDDERVSKIMSELKAIQKRYKVAFGNVDPDFDWKEEYANELYKKYVG